MPKDCHAIVKKMLHPDPKRRATVEDVLKDEWVQSIEVCENGKGRNGHTHEGAPVTVM